jgi:stage II sporulation protein D
MCTAVLVAAVGTTVKFSGDRAVTAYCSVIENTGGVTLSESGTYQSKLTATRRAELEDYLVGVVAAEMPALYGDEALKAQAVAARTYALHTLESAPYTSLKSISQAYISIDDMKKRWGDDFESYYSKIKTAVESTTGEIVTYDDEPILAVFCASSDGTTEDSGNVWSSQLPYLTSVDSHWDTESENFTQTKSFTVAQLNNLMGGVPEIAERTSAGYVKTAYAGDKQYTGIQIRQLLGLKSASFEVDVDGDTVTFTTSGYGHGVGMSQTGAGKMAEEGANYSDILLHYYTGTKIESLDNSSDNSSVDSVNNN